MTLVIMAAGMGSRFGGLKQVEPVGPNGEFILDYSIYDAKKAGFDKVVFIIKKENYELFKDTVGNRIGGIINVEYVFQDMNIIPDFITIPSDRIKPWGTAHAIYCCKDIVKERFAIVNADDFYGYDSYKIMFDYLKDMKENEFCMVGYKVINTLTDNGAVKRGYCEIKEGFLTNLIESSIEKQEDRIIASPLDGRKPFEVKEEDSVSMNMFGFSPLLFQELEKRFNVFFEENKNNLDKCEWLIPDEVFRLIDENIINVKVLETSSKWYGVTYKEDKEQIVNAINEMIIYGIYKPNLWEK